MKKIFHPWSRWCRAWTRPGRASADTGGYGLPAKQSREVHGGEDVEKESVWLLCAVPITIHPWACPAWWQ